MNINDKEICNEFTYANSERIEIRKESVLNPAKRCIENLKFFERKNIPYLHTSISKFSLPLSNLVAEGIFSISNNTWSFQKFQMGPEVLESLVITEFNFKMDFTEFVTYLPNI